MKKIFNFYFPYLALAVLVALPLFGHLDTLCIRVWDESRQAVNAYEMFLNKNYLVVHYWSHPDMWNTKPPFLIWCQVFWIHLIGPGALAIRLPSAIAAFLTCTAILLFSAKQLKSFWFGFLAVMVLITSSAYVHDHAARTGDYDAMLTLFTTLSALSFFIYCENQKKRYLYLCFLALTLAVLTKSISGLLFVPAFLAYALIRKQVLPLLRNPHFYLGLLLFLAPVLAYYLLREQYNPGYIDAVFKNELGGRYLETIEDHNYGFRFYFKNMVSQRYAHWFFLVPFGIAAGLLQRDQVLKRFSLFCTLLVTLFLLIITSSQTKLPWYDVPLYPFMAILISTFLYAVLRLIRSSGEEYNSLKTGIFSIAFLLLAFYNPYRNILAKTYLPKEKAGDKEFYEITYYLREAVNGERNLHQQRIVHEDYNAHNLFYVQILNEQGKDISFIPMQEIKTGQTLIAYQGHVKKYIEDNYHHEVVKTHGNITTYTLYGTK